MQLAAVLDLGAAAPLCEALKAARGSPLQIDASHVERLGGLCLQALLAADAQWRQDGVPFSIVGASEAFVECATIMAAQSLVASGGDGQ